MYFAHLPQGVAGRCNPFINLVQLDLDQYLKLAPIERKALIFHELGHCLCGLGHDNTKLGSCIGDLMYPQMDYALCYIKNWDLYTERLRKKCL